MAVNVSKEVAAMRRMTVPELREKYALVFGEPTTSRHKDYLIRRIIWKIQANDEGGLSERAKRRAQELAESSDVRLTAPKVKAAESPHTKTISIKLSNENRLPMAGTIITRKYKGELIEVRVLPDGFDYNGEIYRSLSAVAKAATGKHWNGYHFFKLGKDNNGKGK